MNGTLRTLVQSPRRPLTSGIAALLLALTGASAQTYTFPGSKTFTDATAWNFGAGPVPASDAALALAFRSFGSTNFTAANDLNLTLNQLDLAVFGAGALTLSSTLSGDFAFSGAAKINLLGSGPTTVFSAPIILGSGATSLTFDGPGTGGLNISGVIAANTTASKPLVIDVDRASITLGGANSFGGGVVLNSGTLLLGNATALGARTNTLTINGGTVRTAAATVAAGTIANDIVLNSTFNYLGATTGTLNPTILTGTLSGSGGVTVDATGTLTALNLRGANTYTGATIVRGRNPPGVTTDSPGILNIQGGFGSILNTSGIQVSDGSTFRLNYAAGQVSGNTRVSAGTAITINGGFLEVMGNTGVTRQNFGTVQVGGYSTIFSTTSGGAPVPLAGATEITVANFVRTPGGTVTFSGPNLGLAAVSAGVTMAQGNILLTQINGGAPNAALVGGGVVGTPNVSILPWAQGSVVNNSSPSTVRETGFVTLGANGVRLLDLLTEYNTSNNFATAGPANNMRITSVPVIDPSAPTTVNSIFFASSGQTIGGSNTLTIASGALATSTASVIISAPLNFGAGEGVVSVNGLLDNTAVSSMTLSGAITANSLVKSGHGRLILSGTGNAITGPITINGGKLQVETLAQLGGATSLIFNGQSYAANRGGITYTGIGAETLAMPIATQGGSMGFDVSGTGVLTLGGPVSGAGGLRKDGTGTLILGGANTFSGGFVLGGGTVEIDSDARLGAPLGPLGLNGGTLRLTGNWTSARGIHVVAATTLVAQANNTALSGPLSGAGSLVKTGLGTLTITSGDNSYSGLLQLGNATTGSGPLVLSGAGALNSAQVQFGAAAAGVAGNYVLDLSGATAASGTPWRSFASLTTGTGFTQSHQVKLGTSAGAPVDLRVNAGNFGGAAGSISGFGKLVKVGDGSLTLNGATANTFTGNTEIWGGTLFVGANNQLGNLANGIVIEGGTLQATASFATDRAIVLSGAQQPIVSSTGFVTLNNSIGANANLVTLTLNGTISSSGGLNVAQGGGTVVLGAAGNSYAGDTQVTNGTLSFTDNAQLGAGTSRIRMSNGQLQFDAAPAVPTTYTVPRAVFLLSGGSFFVTSANATLDLAGPILGGVDSTLFKRSSPGKLAISGDNTSFFGTITVGNTGFPGGGISLRNTGQLRRANVTLGAGINTFDMGGLVREFGDVNINAGNTWSLGAGGKVTSGFNNGNMVWAGNITGDSAASVTKVGAGSLNVTANGNTFGGGFHILSSIPGSFVTSNVTTLSGNGTLPEQSAFTIGAWGNSANRGPVLMLDNTGTNLGNRLADTQVVHSNSGEIQLFTNATTATSETMASLRGAGMTTVSLRNGGTLNFADATTGLTRVNRGTFLFRGSANNLLGTGPASTFMPNLFFGNLLASDLIGGGGAAGSTTVSILPYAIGGSSYFDEGGSFVTYGVNGIRVLNTFTEFNSTPLTAGATENVRAVQPVTLTGGVNKTVNSLLIDTGASLSMRIDSAGAEKLILTSGAIMCGADAVYRVNSAGTAGVPLGIQVAELQTGAGNTRELHIFTGHTQSASDLAIGAKISTSGGLTKSGQSKLFLTNNANTYTGPTTVNGGSLVIDGLGALGGSSILQLGGGFLQYRGGDATLAQTIVAAGGSAADPIGGSAGIAVSSGTTLTVAPGAVSGFGGIYKQGQGVLKLQGNNPYSGATLIGDGVLAIDGPAALGTNGRVVFTRDRFDSSSGWQVLRFDAPMTLTQDFVLNSGESNIGFGFDTLGNNVTLNGTMLGGINNVGQRGLYKFGTGELNLTATEMFTAPTTVFAGTLRLSGANGSLVNSSGVQLTPGAVLVLDNVAANNSNRLADVWDSPLGSGNAPTVRMTGGEMRILGNAAGTNERINRFDIQSGMVTLAGGGTTLTSGLFSRTAATSAGLLRGTNFGGTPGAASTNWFVTDLGGGGVELRGAGGTEHTPWVNILPGFMGDTSATGSGTDLLTYAADTGFRLLTPDEYAATIPAGNFDLNRAPNVALTGAAAVNATTGINALKLGPGASVGGTGTLALYTGTVLATGNASITVPTLNSNVAGANSGYIFLTPGAATTLTVNSVLPGDVISKYGEGTLVLNNSQLAGGIVVEQGTVRLGSASSVTHADTSLAVLAGGIFDLGGSDRVIRGLDNNLLGSAGNGTIALGANRLTFYANGGTFSGQITGTGGLTKAFTSNSFTATFSQPLAYSGPTRIFGGLFQLSGNGTLLNTSAIEIRGGTLVLDNTATIESLGGSIAQRVSTATPITLGGGGIAFGSHLDTAPAYSLGTVALTGGGTLSLSGSGTLTIGNLTRGTGAILNLGAGNDLGLTSLQSDGHQRIFLTQIDGALPASALIGGGGAAGTTTQSILPWVTGFITYGANGLRRLAASEFENNLNAPSSPMANVITDSAVTLSAARTVNALSLGGNITGGFDLTVGSGVVVASSNQTVNTNSLLTGAGNTRELFLYSERLSTLNLTSSLTTTGGVTKLGKGKLALTGSNTFTGGLNIDAGSVLFTADNQLGASGDVVRFGGPAVSTSTDTIDPAAVLAYTGPVGAPLAFNRPVETTGFGIFVGSAAQRWQINQPISGPGAIGYEMNNAVFEINSVNTYAGATKWNGGHLYISGDSAFGNGGDLIFSTVDTQKIVLRGDWTTDRLIMTVATTAIQTNGFDATWNGPVTSNPGFANGISKHGTGTLTLTSAEPFRNQIFVQAGSVRLSGQGSLASAAQIHVVNHGAAFILDDSSIHSSDRLHDNLGGVTLTGGELALIGNASVPTEEVIANMTLSANTASTVTLAPGTGQSAVLRLTGAVTREAGNSTLFRGPGLGENLPGAGSGSRSNFFLNNAPASSGLVVGGDAPAGHFAVSTIPGAFGDTDPAGLGTQLVTYDVDRGVRLLNPDTEYISSLQNGSVVVDNVKAAGTSIALPNNTTANNLWLKDGGSITGAGTLTLTAGALLVTGAGNSIVNPLNANGAVLAIGGPGDVTLAGAIPASQTGGLTKQGAGTLTLAVANAYTGQTTLAGGVVAVGDAAAFGATAVRFQGGELRNTGAGPLTLANSIALNGPLRIGGTQSLTLGGPISLVNATREFDIANTGVTTLSGVISSNQLLVNYGLTKTGPGLLVLANPANTYDGETTVAEGELRVTGSIAGSVLTKVAGGTLSGTGATGPLQMLAGTLAPGSDGVGTLTAQDTAFAGGQFSLEIASAVAADKLSIVGTAALAANTEFSLALLDGYMPAGESWTIIDNDGADPFVFGNFRFTLGGAPIEPLVPFAAAGGSYFLDYAGGTGNDVVVSHVPEPSALAFFAAALPIALRRRKCREQREE